jgi:NTE family protein
MPPTGRRTPWLRAGSARRVAHVTHHGETPPTPTRALVLGGGGLAGIAWHVGMLTGLADKGLDVTDADFIVGTSAGATAGAQVASGVPLLECFRRQVDPTRQNAELRPPGMSIGDLWEAMVRLIEETRDPAELRRRTGTMALDADTVPEAVRRAVVAGRLPSDAWPERRMATTAVDAVTGERRVFESGSEVGLVDAVAASCAVPGIWPPVTIGPSRYVDGGVYSLCNADLAVGFDRVLVLAPMVDPALTDQLATVDASGRSVVVSPNEESLAAFSADALDPAVRAPSAEAGRRQGVEVAASLEDLWLAQAGA